MSKVKGACVEYSGGRKKSGYGVITYYRPDGVRTSTHAHRYFFEQANGPLDEGLTVDHLCFNRACINLEHLEAVTMKEQARRREARRTHCRNGLHLRVDEGHCQPCILERSRRSRATAKRKKTRA